MLNSFRLKSWGVWLTTLLQIDLCLANVKSVCHPTGLSIGRGISPPHLFTLGARTSDRHVSFGIVAIAEAERTPGTVGFDHSRAPPMSWSTLRPRWGRRDRKLKSDRSGMDPDSCRVGWLDVLISVRDSLCHEPDQFGLQGCCRRINPIGWERSPREPIMNTSALHDLWVQLTPTPLFGLTLTILSYLVGHAIQRACRGAALANPVLISILLIGGILGITGTPYRTYFAGAQLIHFLLGPATVALAVPLVRNLGHLRRSLPGVALALTAGSLVSAIGGIALVEICGGSRAAALSMAPKAVTTPIAIEVTQTVGGIPSLGAVLAIASGVLVAISIQSLLRWAKITDWRAFGLAAGTVGSGIGAAHAISFDEIAGAFAALAIGLNGLLTALMVPTLVHFWPHFR